MTNPNARKGSLFERQVRDYLVEAGIFAYRPRQEGHKDVGDIHSPPFVLQAKNYRDILTGIREGVEGVRVQKGHARMPFGVAVVKRPRKPIEDAYVVMRLGDFPQLVRAVTTPQADSVLDTD
ncbi:hypothetical protein [Promicromonospora kroppenstedtii]|uniref:hypothetical protein n=1 Tax=Promicromonospora kroppenstedtii TaxID=440482 RepID=UPI0004B5D817|nr:hypothetical protein [Promicromonospora kroppenstedtii]